jgi:hypothetical protein
MSDNCPSCGSCECCGKWMIARITELEEKEFDWMNELRFNAEKRGTALEAQLETENQRLRLLLDTSKSVEREHILEAENAALEARISQAKHVLERCRTWNGMGYDWHPIHAKRAWEAL